MGILIKRGYVAPEHRLDHKLTGDIENLDKKEKLAVIKAEYTLAKSISPEYEPLKKELAGYAVELPENPDIGQLSKINKLYAIAQSFASRTTAIEMVAIDNQSRWKRLNDLMQAYIEDRECELLISEEVMNYGNSKLQQAAVRNKLSKDFETLQKLSGKLSNAESFLRMAIARKKDLAQVLTTLGKQVHALSVEQALLRN